jgi:hypothetical protein
MCVLCACDGSGGKAFGAIVRGGGQRRLFAAPDQLPRDVSDRRRVGTEPVCGHLWGRGRRALLGTANSLRQTDEGQ